MFDALLVRRTQALLQPRAIGQHRVEHALFDLRQLGRLIWLTTGGGSDRAHEEPIENRLWVVFGSVARVGPAVRDGVQRVWGAIGSGGRDADFDRLEAALRRAE